MTIQKRCGECGNNAECNNADIENLDANECSNFVWNKRILEHREDAAREEREKIRQEGILSFPYKCGLYAEKQEFKRKLAEYCKQAFDCFSKEHYSSVRIAYKWLFGTNWEQDFPELFKAAQPSKEAKR